MQHKTILTQGGIVHYWIARNKNVSDCIVFTHGVTADHTMFEKQIPYFSDNYAIISVGHAVLPIPAGPSI